MLAAVLTLIAIAVGYVCAKEDLRDGEISKKSNIVLLFILFVTLIATMLVNIKIGIIALAMFFLLPISGIGGADVKIVTLFFLIISWYNESYAILFVFLAFVMPLLLPDRKTLKFFLRPYMIVGMIFVIFLKLYVIIAIIYLLLRIFTWDISRYYTKPISELRVGDYPAQYISEEGDVKLHEEASPQFLEELPYFPDSFKVMVGKAMITLGKVKVKKIFPSCLLCHEDVVTTRENFDRAGEKIAVLYQSIRTLPYVFLTFLFLICFIYLTSFNQVVV